MSELAIENTEVRERFTVDNDMKAEWCLSKIRSIRAAQKRDTEELERQMQFYRDQKEMISCKADEDVAKFEEMLNEYFQNRHEAGFTKVMKSKESYSLPTGELKLTHREPEYEYKKDQEKAIEFCEQNGLKDYVKIKKELAWSGLKKLVTVVGSVVALKETGETVPGITVTERGDEFIVEVK